MKSFITGSILFLVLLLQQAAVNAQPNYTFKNVVLTSGSALTTGAKYKFPNVKSGTDAIVTIIAQVGGVTLTEVDNNTTGFDEAFQPFINVNPLAAGYVEFQVDFVSAGTNIPQQQNFIPITCLDVDGVTWGNGLLLEQDQVQFFPGYFDYQMTGGNLVVTMPPGWVAIKNVPGFSYDGIDTSAKDVMATVVNRNVSSFLVRIGAINTSPTHSEVRYRSVYFKSFNYGHPTPLPNRTMLSLNAHVKKETVELEGTLSASHSYDRMIIERASTPGNFGYIGEINIAGTATAEYHFTFLDKEPVSGTNYYRVRMLNSSTLVNEISNTVSAKMNTGQNDLVLINPVVAANNPVLSLRSDLQEDALFQLHDMSGRLMKEEKHRIYSGTNNITLPGFSNAKGYHVIVVRTKNRTVSGKLWIQ